MLEDWKKRKIFSAQFIVFIILKKNYEGGGAQRKYNTKSDNFEDQRGKFKTMEKNVFDDGEVGKKRQQLEENNVPDQKQDYKRTKFDEADRFFSKSNPPEREPRPENDGNLHQKQNIIDIRDINIFRDPRGRFLKKEYDRDERTDQTRFDFCKRKEKDQRRFDYNNNSNNNTQGNFQDNRSKYNRNRKHFNFQYQNDNVSSAACDRGKKFNFGVQVY